MVRISITIANGNGILLNVNADINDYEVNRNPSVGFRVFLSPCVVDCVEWERNEVSRKVINP